MKKVKRSEFLGTIAEAIPGGDDEQKGAPGTNRKPASTSRSNTGLNPYTGAFGKEELVHLLRRTMFGVKKADLDHFTGKTLDEVMAELLTQSPAPAPPLATGTTDPDATQGTTWVNGGLDFTGIINVQRMFSMKAWWVGQMINQDRSLTEKMTLFWHNHFATEANIVQDARYVYKHNALLRSYALGNFKALARAVTTDPAMLVYQNGNTNTKGAPNENYARELQELFTVGKGPDSKYTEDDVIAAARVLTGWRDNIISKPLADGFFDASRHDTGNKQFSAFYNNTLITGKSGANGATEVDELLDMIFAQTEVAKFICRKLYRFFIYYVIDQQVEDDIITPLASLFVSNNYDIKPVLEKLFKSEHFFDTLNRGCYIKTPADHLVGIARQFNMPFPGSSDLVNQYDSWFVIYYGIKSMNMDLGDPPSVSGWPAFYQEPGYHELWINSNTLQYRSQYSDVLSNVILPGKSEIGFYYNNAHLYIDSVAFTKTLANPGDPNKLIEEVAFLLCSNPLSAEQIAAMKSILLSQQAQDYYWTNAWTQYINDPGNTGYLTTVQSRLRAMYQYVMAQAEFQLL